MQYRPSDYRIPRTLNEAFGPYAELHRMEEGKLSKLINFLVSLFR